MDSSHVAASKHKIGMRGLKDRKFQRKELQEVFDSSLVPAGLPRSIRVAAQILG